jgi:hypothetical protein
MVEEVEGVEREQQPASALEELLMAYFGGRRNTMTAR